MAATTRDAASPRLSARIQSWLLEGLTTQANQPPGPHKQATEHHQHPWWKVMCLTGVDYFSTLGYQPGIAALAAGVLSPVATILLVLLTLFGALPIYRRVAAESPHGEGSIAMLERLLPWWRGKLFVLALLGFVATDFIITITLSAADATAHVLENPLVPGFLDGHQVAITLSLIALLGGIFLKGFTEAIGIAVGLVAVYLALNFVVVAVALQHLAANPTLVVDWRQLLITSYSSPLAMVAVALVVFPKLALGLSGFETGVAVMPLVRGDPGDTAEHPRGRIRNTRKLLVTAALIMSGFLITSSFATTVLIPHQQFEEGGQASGRALAYLAHQYLGSGFGTAYDLSTIGILWLQPAPLDGAEDVDGLVVHERPERRIGVGDDLGPALDQDIALAGGGPMLAGMEGQRDVPVALDAVELLAEPQRGREPDPAGLAVPQPKRGDTGRDRPTGRGQVGEGGGEVAAEDSVDLLGPGDSHVATIAGAAVPVSIPVVGYAWAAVVCAAPESKSSHPSRERPTVILTVIPPGTTRPHRSALAGRPTRPDLHGQHRPARHRRSAAVL